MESTVSSPAEGNGFKRIHLTEGVMVEQDDMVVELE